MRARPDGMAGRLFGKAAAFGADKRGVTLVEFALILPLMVMLFYGMVEFGEAFAVSRKVSNAASTMSDLVAQGSSITDAQLDDIARVADELIKPYRTDNMRIVVTSVQADVDNNTTVGWSYARGTGATARIQGDSMVLPPGLTEANSSVIVAETTYLFTPSIGFFLTGVIELDGEAYFRPRISRLVIKTD